MHICIMHGLPIRERITWLHSRHACSRTDATLFWTCIKIAKALRDFHGEE